jgi:hypothetical protein
VHYIGGKSEGGVSSVGRAREGEYDLVIQIVMKGGGETAELDKNRRQEGGLVCQ